MAPLLIFEEQDYRTFFRFDFRGESYLIPIFLKDRTIANVQQIFGGEDGAILFFFSGKENYREFLKSI